LPDERISRVETGSNTSTVALRVAGGDEKANLESEIVKYGRESRDSNPRMTALARARSNCKRQTRPLVRVTAAHQQTRNRLTVLKIFSQAPDGCFIPRQTGRLTVGTNISLRLRRESYVRDNQPQLRSRDKWTQILRYFNS
jgi:hypothetical protein